MDYTFSLRRTGRLRPYTTAMVSSFRPCESLRREYGNFRFARTGALDPVLAKTCGQRTHVRPSDQLGSAKAISKPRLAKQIGGFFRVLLYFLPQEPHQAAQTEGSAGFFLFPHGPKHVGMKYKLTRA